jgi:hypothetical protein
MVEIMKRPTRLAMLRLTSRVDRLTNRLMGYGAVVACCLGVLSAVMTTWGSRPIGSALLAVVVTFISLTFGMIAADLLIGGYARFRARADRGRVAMAYFGLLIALAAASFFLYCAVSSVIGFLSSSF